MLELRIASGCCLEMSPFACPSDQVIMLLVFFFFVYAQIEINYMLKCSCLLNTQIISGKFKHHFLVFLVTRLWNLFNDNARGDPSCLAANRDCILIGYDILVKIANTESSANSLLRQASSLSDKMHGFVPSPWNRDAIWKPINKTTANYTFHSCRRAN